MSLADDLKDPEAATARKREYLKQLTRPLTEAGDAEAFADSYKEYTRFDHRRARWLVRDLASGIWVPDPVERLTQMTVSMMRDRQVQSLSLHGEEKKKAINWTIKGEGRARLNNALAIARSVPPLADAGDNWDENKFLLGVQNGVVDLLTGEHRKAEAEDRITMRVRVDFDPDATCPLWVDTLAAIFEDSVEMLLFMQRALGYSITGDCREECCFFTWGGGSNGKGTVMNTLGWLFGDYTDDMPYATLERREHGMSGGIPNDIAKIESKRFITCSEVNEFSINEARLKALTGRDPITARFLNREFFTFMPVCKIWVATNHKPKIMGQDDGIWRRIHLIPFVHKFEGDSVNKQLKDQLREELPGILNWVLEGTRMWLRDGLNPPWAVQTATEEYRHESNPVTPFIEECCVIGERFQMQALLAFKDYEKFCHEKDMAPWKRLTNKAFFKALDRLFEKVGNRQVFYVGVQLLANNTSFEVEESQM